MLSETGIVGGVLFFGAFVLGLGGMLWPRFSAGRRSVRRRGPPGRWGDDPQVYAWETALAIGVLYWLIHASVEWLWHMPGVTLVTVFMFALGVASVDARAGVLWPRVAAFLPRRERRDRALAPPGRISLWFRRVLVLTAVVTLVVLGLPYLSLRLQDVAHGQMGTNDPAALRAARLAARVQPVDPRPVLAEADVYRYAAAGAPTEAALDDLALSLDAHMRAIDRNPPDWALYQRAGLAALRLLEVQIDVPEGSLTGAATQPRDGTNASLVTPETRKRATSLRAFAPEEVRLLARSYFLAAQRRNPLNLQVKAALEATERAAVLTGAVVPGS